MHETITRMLNKWGTLKTVLPLLVLTITLMVVINTAHLPITVPRIQEVSQGADILDMHIFYSKTEVYSLLEQLQPEGRRIYIKLLMGFDFAFPALYAVTFSLIVSTLYRSSRRWIIRTLVWLPLMAGVFDWSENVSIIMILLKYPVTSVAAYAAGFLTLGKWISIWLSLGVVFAGLCFKLTKVGILKNDIRNNTTAKK
ncbi:hypothetical protein JI735_20130 [Paenibacillus sonchi]|uniref:Uncharacterized protein n=1 Tax=Paenibacillus sonchi TaxID=373687 RepID=A0A974P7V1_9BACL|nr:hypothetical protein [Paenibacillus sonchi]QQZ59029.1 hypothetical protein JI735_20130 [Paenibacillus sonchi]